MQFSTSFLIAALPFLAAAAPAANNLASYTPVTSSGPVGLIATRSASPVHLQSINASGQAFWIGKETASFCPAEIVKPCPPGEYTVIDIFGNEKHPGSASMDTVVPGGQLMYIRKNGALGFTQAHSALIPEGAFVTGFTFTPGEQFGHFGVSLPGSAGLLACPSGPNYTGPWQVFANLKGLKDSDVTGGKISKCLGINAIAANTTSPGAWQYT